MKTISAQALVEQFGLHKKKISHDVVIIDVREPNEFAQEHIAGAINIPLNNIQHCDIATYKDKIAIFHCQAGRRTAMNAQALTNTPFKAHYCMEGGLAAWKALQLPTECETHSPINVLRQVQLIVSLMVLLGVILAYLISPYFIILTVMGGAGLLIAGLTGFCPLVEVLARMPWNAVKK